MITGILLVTDSLVTKLSQQEMIRLPLLLLSIHPSPLSNCVVSFALSCTILIMEAGPGAVGYVIRVVMIARSSDASIT